MMERKSNIKKKIDNNISGVSKVSIRGREDGLSSERQHFRSKIRANSNKFGTSAANLRMPMSKYV